MINLVRDARDGLPGGIGVSGSEKSDSIFGRFVGRSILMELLFGDG